MDEQSTTHPDKGMSFNNKKSIILIPLGQSQKRHDRWKKSDQEIP